MAQKNERVRKIVFKFDFCSKSLWIILEPLYMTHWSRVEQYHVGSHVTSFVIFLFCELHWIKASSKLINLNIKCFQTDREWEEVKRRRKNRGHQLFWHNTQFFFFFKWWTNQNILCFNFAFFKVAIICLDNSFRLNRLAEPSVSGSVWELKQLVPSLTASVEEMHQTVIGSCWMNINKYSAISDKQLKPAPH